MKQIYSVHLCGSNTITPDAGTNKQGEAGQSALEALAATPSERKLIQRIPLLACFIFFLSLMQSHGQSSTTWQAVGTKGFTAGVAANTSLALAPNGTPFVAFKDGANGNRVSVMKYTGTAWQSVGPAGFSSAEIHSTSIVLDANGTPYIVYQEANADRIYNIAVKKFNGSGWVALDPAGLSDGAVDYFALTGSKPSLALDANGAPYIAYQDMNNRSRAIVKKYNGSVWVTVGNAGFSANVAQHNSLALGANGIPHVAYRDNSSGSVTVMKFNGTSWVNVGIASFSAGTMYAPSLAIDASGIPYVAFSERNNDHRATVMKFNGTEWVTVGNARFSQFVAMDLTLVLDAFGIPHVSYREFSNIDNVKVMKFDGSSWAPLSTARITEGAVSSPSLALNANGVPHLAYQDGENGEKATVMRLNLPTSLTITTQPVSKTITGGQNTSFAVTASGGLTYQWQVSRDGGATFQNISNGLGYSGATTSTLTLTKVPISMNGYRYRVQVNNGSLTTSNTVTLTVNIPGFDNTRTWQVVGQKGISAGSAHYNVLALNTAGTPFLAYQDAANGYKASVMKLNGSTWGLVGNAGFSGEIVRYIIGTHLAFAIDPNGTPYVAHQNVSNGDKITVLKFNGTAWTGTAVSTTRGNYPSLAFNASGTPFVAFQDEASLYGMTVKKLNGTNWEVLGTPGFSSGTVSHTAMALDGNGIPYVAFTDGSMEGGARTTVMKYNGTRWELVGSAGFSTASSQFNSLAIDASGTPYVAYKDASGEEKITVKKFNGSTWVTMGTERFSTGRASNVRIVLDASGTPFVSYDNNNGAPTVMRFNGTGWVQVGSTSFYGHGASVVVDAQGTPYLAYSDGYNQLKATVLKFAAIANATPTNIMLSKSTVNENVAANTIIGTFSTTDADAGDTHTYTLVAGTGATDNASFTIDGNSLRIKSSPDYETKSSYSIRVRTSDEKANGTFEKAFTIQVIDLDEVKPTLTSVTIASNNPDATRARVGNVVTVSFTASEPLQTPTATIAGRAATVAPVGASTTQYTASYTMAAGDAEGQVAFSISYRDLAGNIGTNATATTNGSKVTFDKTAPTVTISSTVSNPTNSKPIPLTLTFSEAVTGLAAGGFAVVNGSVTRIATTDNRTYTIDFTPTANGAVTVSLPAGRVADAAGNGNTASNTWSGNYDATRPSVTLTTPAANPTNAAFTVTFTFSQAVTGFAISDITVANGAASEFSAVSTTVYRAKITPANQGTVSVSVGENVAQNATKSGNTASTVLTRTFDSIAPAGYTVAFNQSAIGVNNQANASVKVTKAEAGSSYSYTITSAGGGTPVTGSGAVSATTFDIPSINLTNLKDGQLTLTLKLTDAAQNAGANATAKVVKDTRTNAAPTAITLSRSDLDENNAVGAVIGTFTSTDPDANDSHTYTLVAGEGSANNSSFTLEGNTLKAAQVFDYETKSSYSIRVRTSDSGGLTFEVVKVITVNDVQETVTGIADERNQMLKAYPNPATNYLVVSFDRTMDSVSLVNSLGATVLTKQVGAGQMHLSLEPLASGVYTLLVSTKDKLYSRRIVVVK